MGGVPITVLLYSGPLLRGCNVPIKWLTYSTIQTFTEEIIVCMIDSCRLFVTIDRALSDDD